MIAQMFEKSEESLNMIINVRTLNVCAHTIFGLPPERIHRIQFGRPFGKPQQIHAIPLSQLLGATSRRSGVFVQQQGHVPAAVAFVYKLQEILKSLLFVAGTDQEEAVPCSKVEHSVNDSASISTGQQYFRRLSPFGPSGSQGWEEQQVGFVLRQDHASGRQIPDLPQKSAFFIALGIGSQHIAGALSCVAQRRQSSSDGIV